MNKFLAIAIIFAAVVLEIAVAPRLKFGGVSPNLLLVALVYVGLLANRQEILMASFAGGLFLDLFSSFPFGIFAVIFVLIGILLNESKYYLFARANFFVILLATSIATILFYILFSFLLKIFILSGISQMETFFKENIFFLMPKELLMNLIAAMAIFIFLRIIRRPFAAKTAWT